MRLFYTTIFSFSLNSFSTRHTDDDVVVDDDDDDDVDVDDNFFFPKR